VIPESLCHRNGGPRNLDENLGAFRCA